MGKTRAELIEVIEKTLNHALQEHIKDAFLRVPRHLFVPFHYVQVQPGQWNMQEVDEEKAYTDVPLITKIHPETKRPSSSSSQPSIMASMLEALDLRPGLSVLEIGTGSGYNAALIAEIVGTRGRVTSIDIDAMLIETTNRHIRKAGYMNVETAVADGLQPYGSEYDRIIVTGGYPTIPATWIEQLSCEGILVGNLLESLASPLFRVQKNGNTLSGMLLPTPAFFMPLFGAENGRRHCDLAALEAAPLLEQERTDFDLKKAIYEPGFAQFLDIFLPGLSVRVRVEKNQPELQTCLIHQEETLLTITPEGVNTWSIRVHGTFALWTTIKGLAENWKQQGSPGLEKYILQVQPQKQQITIHPMSISEPTSTRCHVNERNQRQSDP